MRTALGALVVLLAAVPARADVVDFNLTEKVIDDGRSRPFITVQANEDATDCVIKLQRQDGKNFSFRTGRMRAGQNKRFTIDVPRNVEQHFTGTMEVYADGDVQTAHMDFRAEIVKPAEVTLDKAKVNLAAHTMELRSTRKTARIEVSVTSDRGMDLGTTTINFDDVAPGTPLPITWRQTGGTVLKIAVRVVDPDNFYAGIELYPWRIDIPHEDVLFATGSFAIDRTEEPKLDSCLEDILAAVEKYGQWAQVKLFVAGHTDTVGNADSNRGLSLNRARSISGYFRKKGLRIPIFYEGFGEDALAVPTPDETNEIRNRRAEYIVAIEPPAISNSARAASWKPLK